jgi:hypothetical protein
MRIIGIIIAVLFVCFLALYFFAGMFDAVSLEISEVGPYAIVYKEHTGPYDGLTVTLRDVYGYVTKKRMQWTTKGIEIFYDDPKTVGPRDQRSIAGCVTDTLLTNVAAPYKSQILPKTPAIVGTVRVRSFLSNVFGTQKFYSVKDNFARENKRALAGPVMQLYDMAARKIYYFAPVK